MHKDYLSILIVDHDEGNTVYFSKIFEDLKISIQIKTLQDYTHASEYLNSDAAVTPDILWINYENRHRKCLDFLNGQKTGHRFSDIIIAVYAGDSTDAEISSLLVKGANIYFNKPLNYSELKKTVSEIITVSWQYHTSGLNKNNMMMKFL